MVVVSSEENLRPGSADGCHVNDNKEDWDVLTAVLEGCLESLPLLSTQPPGAYRFLQAKADVISLIHSNP